MHCHFIRSSTGRVYCEHCNRGIVATLRDAGASGRTCRGARDQRPPRRTDSRSAMRLSVSVIIISHNYGRFLPEAVDSVLGQSARLAEIVIIDDVSTDETRRVARRYAPHGVQYLSTQNSALSTRHFPSGVHQARRAGYEATRGEILCFLDADDILPPDYLERGLPFFADPAVGLVISDVQEFGERSCVKHYAPDGALDQRNFAHAGSLVRRAALDQARAFDVPLDPRRHQDDWFLWRRVAQSGWKIARQPSLYRYRRHAASQSVALKRRQTAWFDLAALEFECITIFIPLSGRTHLWPGLRDFLERQRWPHSQCRLVLADTSRSPEFGRRVREWALRSDYPDIRVYSQEVGEPSLADGNRRDPEIRRAVQLAMPRIYNRMARELGTEFVWVIEDDIVPPLDAAERLLRGFDADTASVSGAYLSRFNGCYVAWDEHFRAFRLPQAPSPRGKLCRVGGNGFGCVMLRRSVIASSGFFVGDGHWQ